MPDSSDTSDVQASEIMSLLFADLYLAASSMAFVYVYLLLYMRSWLLTTLTLFIIMGSIPFAFTLYSALAGPDLHMAQFLSLFLVVGLGADIVFVYIDTWRQSAGYFEEDDSQRLLWTIKRGG